MFRVGRHRVKRVARRANPYDRLARRNMLANQIEHGFRRRPAANAQHQQIRVFDRFRADEIIVPLFR